MTSPHRPNLLFIVLDTHRSDRLGAYGYRRGASPNLDAFASQSTIFDHAIAPGQWTVPSHASMFSGEFPTTHLTTQSGDMLDPYFRTAAEWLKRHGYRTTGFCNNPLVGVLDNGLKRGFDAFYNYGGAIPSTPVHARRYPIKLLNQFWELYTRWLRKISYPVQNAIAKSERILRLTLHPAFVPLWTRFAHFKGNTPLSLADAAEFVQHTVSGQAAQPHFVFINLMETHLPFTPPQQFIARFAPIMKEERQARDFMRLYNTQAFHWLLPMAEPFRPIEAETLSQMYDAEVAYQDHLLERLLATLDTPYHRANTAVVIVADHGELLGEHSLMGHGLGAYEELIRVPLFIRTPGQTASQRIAEPVSTAQIFHTLLHLAEADDEALLEWVALPLERLSLSTLPQRKAAPAVFSEAYPPTNLINNMAREAPHLFEVFPARQVIRAAYNPALDKLIHVEGLGVHCENLTQTPAETRILPGVLEDGRSHPLAVSLELFISAAEQRRPQHWTRQQVSLDDRLVAQRLRDLGYIE
jgi:uncharacterized sulfatase